MCSLLLVCDCFRGLPPKIPALIIGWTTSTSKAKILAIKGKEPIRTKTIVNNNIIKQVRNFYYLGCQLGS
jgi:hypothetical protein